MLDTTMTGRFLVPIIFAALALVFALLAWRGRDQPPSVLSPARKTRLRIAVIFALVSGVLFFLA